MTYRIVAGNIPQLEDLLNNARLLVCPREGLPIGGRTIIFSTPVATVTFPGAAGAQVTPVAMATALKGVSGLEVELRAEGAAHNSISLRRDGGFTIASTGTANADFLLSTTAATVVAAPVPTARVVAISQGAEGGQLVALLSST